jgi:serine/threonine protein kinase
LDEEHAAEIFGEVAVKLLDIREPDAAAADNRLEMPDSGAEPASKEDVDNHTRQLFFTAVTDKYVLVISTPFRKGSHVAKRPNDFLPIIEQLQKIHDAGYVHGDIRASNTVFSGDLGYLIDFDFSGKAGTARYPTGYVRNLDDGNRMGFEEQEIEKWQDWFDFGQVMFFVHEFLKPKAEEDQQLRLSFVDCKDYWMALETEPPVEKVDELKEILSIVEERGWTVKPSRKYQSWLDMADKQDHKTKQGATGSPPRRKLPFR